MHKIVYTNEQIIKDICSKIETSPSTYGKKLQDEKDFLTLFKDKSQSEIAGIVTVEPHTANIFMAVLFDRVVQLGLIDSLSSTNIFDYFRTEDLSNGLYWSKVMTDILVDEAYNAAASPIGVFAPRIVECYSDTPVRRDVPVTYSLEQLSTAFTKPTGVSEILTSLLKRARDTINLNITDAILDEIMSQTVPGTYDNFTNVVIGAAGALGINPFSIDSTPDLADLTVVAIDDGAAVDPLIVQQDVFTPGSYTESGMRLATLLKMYAQYMATPGTLYNIGDTDGPFTSNIPLGEGVLLINSAFSTLMNLGELTFFKKEEWKSYFKEIIYINSSKLTNANHTLVAGIVDRNAIDWKFLLDKTLTFENARSLYVNYFVHYWYAILINPFVNGVLLSLTV